jgi:hypothetical protein
MQVIFKRDSMKPISGRIEIDDSPPWAKRVRGKRGRGAAGKTPLIAAVETTNDKRPLHIRLMKVRGFSKKAHYEKIREITGYPPSE